MREEVSDVGLDAYCSIVLDLDNQGHVSVYSSHPAPQAGDIDHYETFLDRICRLYSVRYGNLNNIAPLVGQTVEESLIVLSRQYPELLNAAGQLAIVHQLPGAAELFALLQSLQSRATPSAGDRSI